MEAAHKQAAGKSAFSEYDYSTFYYGAGDDPLNLLRPYADRYREARPNGYYLYQEALGSAPSTHIRVRNGKTGQCMDLFNMASHNYLGISYRPEVKKAAAEALEKYGLGASGSPILSGTFDVHEEFTAELARFKDKEAFIHAELDRIRFFSHLTLIFLSTRLVDETTFQYALTDLESNCPRVPSRKLGLSSGGLIPHIS